MMDSMCVMAKGKQTFTLLYPQADLYFTPKQTFTQCSTSLLGEEACGLWLKIMTELKRFS
eukprot:2505981-Prymnesium_polylepis.1